MRGFFTRLRGTKVDVAIAWIAMVYGLGGLVC